jgi:hypothetical protein
MTRHVDDGLLQDFQEGLLPPQTEEEVRGHLAECPRCRSELRALADLLSGMAELPQEAHPSRDLWPQIAWRIAGHPTAAESGAAVERVGPEEASPGEGSGRDGSARDRLAGRRARGWRVELPAWQLLAAGIVVAILSGASVWGVLSGRGEGSGPGSEISPWTAQQAGWVEAYGGYDQAVADLEAVLEQGRRALDPETIRILEENMATIDRAIQEARAALAMDPGSAVVRRILTESLRQKVSLLRHAVSVVYAHT